MSRAQTMQTIYWAHGYRIEDAVINRHFGTLIEQAARMIVNFDPPSDRVNASKLEQNLRSCDGMVAILPWRPAGPSPYILYEVGLALRSRKPLLVFIDDRLSGNQIPRHVIQRRYSHRTYFREVREHTHALRELSTYMGEPPAPKYHSGARQRACGLIGLRKVSKTARTTLVDLVEQRGYRTLDLDSGAEENPLRFEVFENIADMSVSLRCVDSTTRVSQFWAGALSFTGTPSITFSLNSSFQISNRIPREFQPRIINSGDPALLRTIISDEFELLEQDFLKSQDTSTIERYTQMQVQAGDFKGPYEANTRKIYTEVIMGDQYNVSGQAGVVGRQGHSHDMNFRQIWHQAQGSIDLSKLANELQSLHLAMQTDAMDSSQQVATSAVDAAKREAQQGNGVKVFEHLKLAGRWALSVAEKIGVSLAAAVIKSSLEGEFKSDL